MYNEECVSMVDRMLMVKYDGPGPNSYEEFVKDKIRRDLTEKIMTILEHEDEIVIVKKDTRLKENLELDVIEYRGGFSWDKLVKCKRCVFNDGDSSYRYCCKHHKKIDDDNNYCSWGRPWGSKEDQNGVSV